MLMAPPAATHAWIPAPCRTLGASNDARHVRAKPCASSRRRDDGPASSYHWTDKLAGESRDSHDATSRTFRADLLANANAQTENETEKQQPTLVGVLRDRDNVTLLNDFELAVPHVAEAFQVSNDDATSLIQRLFNVAPGVSSAKPGMTPVPLILRLCEDVLNQSLSQKIVELRTRLPSDVDLTMLVEADPQILLEAPERVVENMLQLKALFPMAGGEPDVPGVDRMCRCTPQLLDAKFAKQAVNQLAAAYGNDASKAALAVHCNPRIVLQVESGALRSDFGPGAWRRRTSSGESDAMYSSHRHDVPTSARGHAVDPTRVFF
ncbi:hypothetical protein RI054_03g16150 [Pseudoscourfieldia marina]